MNSDEMPYIIYDDIESLIKTIDEYANNPGNSSATKIVEHIFCGDSMSTILGFDNIKNKSILYLGGDCTKKFCNSLRKHAKNVIYFEKKNMLPLTKEELEKIQKKKMQNCYTCWNIFLKNFVNDENYRKNRDLCHYTGKYRGAAYISNLKFNVLNEIPAVFHSGSNYKNDFIRKELANEFEGQFECIGENAEK